MVIDIGSLGSRRQIIKPRDLPSPLLVFSQSNEMVIVTHYRRGEVLIGMIGNMPRNTTALDDHDTYGTY